MLASRGKHQQRLGIAMQMLLAIEEQLAQGLARFRPAGLSGDDDAYAARLEKLRKPCQMGTLARTIDTLQCDEFPVHQRRPFL